MAAKSKKLLGIEVPDDEEITQETLDELSIGKGDDEDE